MGRAFSGGRGGKVERERKGLVCVGVSRKNGFGRAEESTAEIRRNDV